VGAKAHELVVEPACCACGGQCRRKRARKAVKVPRALDKLHEIRDLLRSDPSIILDYSAAGKVVGIEMLYLSQRVAPDQLARMQLESVSA